MLWDSKLTQFQLQKLSEFFLTFSQIVLGSLVLKIFEPGVETVLDRGRLLVIYSALIVSGFLFTVGMAVAGTVEEKK
jgi:hypothetical protein